MHDEHTSAPAAWVTIEEAVQILAERGITGRDGTPLRPITVAGWCRRGVLTQTQRHGGPRRGIWLIARAELESVTPPSMGRPRDPAPSPLAQAQRASRARRASQVSGDGSKQDRDQDDHEESDHA